MIQGSESGLLDLGLERYIILAQKWCLAGEGRSDYFQCQSGILLWKADLLIFGAKMTPCCGGWIQVLGNSFTGSGNIAKCSNILQDTALDFFEGSNLLVR
jgi:hypothetical protein